jgi:iron-sulfur cluster repair protein YtfE (RIC family)
LLLPASCSQTITPEEAIMNALELLKRDHDSITALLAGADAYTDMKRLFERIKSELEIHGHIEETAFYPLLQNHELLKESARDAKAQHALIKELLSDLAKQEGAEFEKNFQALKAEVQLHFTEEENEIFPQVANLKKDRDLDRLAEQLATNKKEYQRTAP